MRKLKSKIKIYEPDPKFKDPLVTRFVNHLMKNGKKTIAYTIFYNCINEIEKKNNKKEKSGLKIWKEALDNVMPHVEVRSRRIGGSNIQVPTQIPPDVKVTKAMKSLINCARERNEKKMSKKLAGEILSAYKKEGASFKKRENIHKMAEANKAFSHFKF
ncbi:30S ribosomal protein S7 [Candidatus Karelsulcia muelleri]|uniref:30S ribosomal protein S7 n=1 Tax=Candidatus Karelsulcia muelleri TaxID=336810 RepID=UPI0035C8FC1D